MLRLMCLFGVVLIAVPIHAQIGASELTLAGMSDCIKDAIGTGSMENNGPIVIFSCNAAKAKTLYNFLGRKVQADVVQDRNGKFENRQFGNNACYHRIEDSSGKIADDFRCDLLLTIGDVLSDSPEAK
jgi:hypothetical protein